MSFINGRVKPKTIKLVIFAPPLKVSHKGIRTNWLRVKIMCPIGLPTTWALRQQLLTHLLATNTGKLLLRSVNAWK